MNVLYERIGECRVQANRKRKGGEVEMAVYVGIDGHKKPVRQR